MFRDVYSISERICRDLPDQTPGFYRLQIVGTGPLRPTDLEATASGIHFKTSRGSIVLQCVPPTWPLVDTQMNRNLLFLMVDCRKKKPLFFDRDLSIVRAFLRQIGASRLGHGMDDLKKEIARREQLLSL